VKLEALSRDHDRQGFDCGVDDLNIFLRQQARQAQDKGLSRTFVATVADSSPPRPILGYFSLVASEALSDSLPPELARKLPTKIPAITLARLAVDRRHQGKGLGGALLAEALLHIARLSYQLRIAGTFVDAKDDSAARFYQHHGFVPLPSDPLRLFMPLARIQELG
jgi:GNAT superfamily N-acetyltransferase